MVGLIRPLLDLAERGMLIGISDINIIGGMLIGHYNDLRSNNPRYVICPENSFDRMTLTYFSNKDKKKDISLLMVRDNSNIINFGSDNHLASCHVYKKQDAIIFCNFSKGSSYIKKVLFSDYICEMEKMGFLC